MPLYRTHLTLLEEAASLHPTTLSFRVPLVDCKTSEILDWASITYSQFHRDVEHFARYWACRLSAEQLPQRSVIGLWLAGTTYVDVLHIYGVARAGYIPQLFSLRLPNPDVILELLEMARGKAVIYDSSYHSAMSTAAVRKHVAIDARAIDLDDTTPLPPVAGEHGGDDTVMVFHTSGSTSGRPKLVPCSYSWWDNVISKGWQVMKPKSDGKKQQDVVVAMGSMCHIGQTYMFVGALQHNYCTVLYHKQDFSSATLADMITRCGLTRINQFPPYLATHLHDSRSDAKLLKQLQGLDEIFISGLQLSSDDEQWAYSNGLKITNCYGSTECTSMMLSSSGDWNGRTPPLRPVDGVSYAFVPISPPSPTETGYHSTNSQLLELVVLADSQDCPDRSLRHADGNYHTGDLFQEVTPGGYAFRGRDDDWIKSQSSLRCDTKAIEDNVRMTCGDLVADCIVVGNGRPSPALFVEPSVGMEHEKLKREIIRRTRHFHSRRYMHERIVSPDFVIVVPPNTLPRTATKGNIRRRAVEGAFQVQLDRLYGVSK